MNIQELDIDQIRPYEKNPRNNDSAVASVARSIKAYGFKVPIIVDKNMVIIAGHTRYKASKLLGLTKVPVIISDLSESKAKAYRIADNKTNEIATWDNDKLDTELSFLDADVMSEYGFEKDEFSLDDDDNLFENTDGIALVEDNGGGASNNYISNKV